MICFSEEDNIKQLPVWDDSGEGTKFPIFELPSEGNIRPDEPVHIRNDRVHWSLYSSGYCSDFGAPDEIMENSRRYETLNFAFHVPKGVSFEMPFDKLQIRDIKPTTKQGYGPVEEKSFEFQNLHEMGAKSGERLGERSKF